MKKWTTLLFALLMLAGAAAASAVSGLSAQQDGLHANIQQAADSPEWVTALPAAQTADQLFIVAGMGMDKTTAFISMHERDAAGAWKQILSTPGFVGRNGLCPDAEHAEGCGQTPIGVYRFNRAFGIAADPGCALPYLQVDDNLYWSGDPDRHYNEMVDIREVPELAMDDSEHIVDYEYQYQYCLNISFNEDGVPGRGDEFFRNLFPGPAREALVPRRFRILRKGGGQQRHQQQAEQAQADRAFHLLHPVSILFCLFRRFILSCLAGIARANGRFQIFKKKTPEA